MADHEALNLFEPPNLAAVDEKVATGIAEKLAQFTLSREAFLTGLLAQWAASDRELGAKPTPEEKRRAAETARRALT